MLEKTLGIVLHIIPYNDKISVAHLTPNNMDDLPILFHKGVGKKLACFGPSSCRSLFWNLI